MSQDVVQQGQDYVFATHADEQTLTGLYGAVDLMAPDGSVIAQPAADVVQVPRDFVYAFDEFGRKMDPRRFAGEGGTPIGP